MALQLQWIIFTALLYIAGTNQALTTSSPGKKITIASKGFLAHIKESDCFLTVCNATKNYPTKQIRKLLNKNKKAYNQMFGTVIEPHEIVPLLKYPTVRKEENFCDSIKVTVFPKVASTMEGTTEIIVNVKGREQSVTFEICAQKECYGGKDLFGYNTTCKQLYNMVRLLYLGRGGGKLEIGQFVVPSACVCTYTKTYKT